MTALGTTSRPLMADLAVALVLAALARRTHSPLTGCPGTTPRRPRSVAGWGRAFGACCFAGKLRSPAGSGPVPPWPRPATPTLVGTLVPTPATAYLLAGWERRSP
jgi:hypothetical protein